MIVVIAPIVIYLAMWTLTTALYIHEWRNKYDGSIDLDEVGGALLAGALWFFFLPGLGLYKALNRPRRGYYDIRR